MSNLRVKLPAVTSLVARSAKTHVIGRENRLPWHLGTDLKRFKERTLGHVVIMGRKTYESIGRPLPKRVNIVLSRNALNIEGILSVPNVENAIHLAENISIKLQRKEFFVIGGENIYNLFLPWINKVFLTEVHDAGVNGDAHFDVNFDETEWRLFRKDSFEASAADDHPFDMLCYIRNKSVQRFEFKEKFLQSRPFLAPFVDPYLEDASPRHTSRQMAFATEGVV